MTVVGGWQSARTVAATATPYLVGNTSRITRANSLIS
jgi:hypothetical protein